jgi:hypothetical protein
MNHILKYMKENPVLRLKQISITFKNPARPLFWRKLKDANQLFFLCGLIINMTYWIEIFI